MIIIIHFFHTNINKISTRRNKFEFSFKLKMIVSYKHFSFDQEPNQMEIGMRMGTEFIFR